MVPIASHHATGNPRLKTPARRLSAQRQAAAAPACRPILLGVVLPALVGVATHLGVRPTSHRHCLAEETIPRLLATLESEW